MFSYNGQVLTVKSSFPRWQILFNVWNLLILL